MSGFAFGNTGFGGLAATPAGANTFLALCQNAVVECGAASRSSIPTVLPSVNTTVGSLGRIVKWVNEAWLDIQMELDDWEWMRSTNVLNAGAQFQTIAGQPSYPLGFGPGTVGIDPDAFGKWDEKSFYSYTTSVGKGDEVELDIIPFESWRSSFMYGANRFVRSRPVAVALGPDQSVCLGPPSNGLYTITADYFVAPTMMVNDTDVPQGIPRRFVMLIVYLAMMKYGEHDSSPEVFARGSRESRRLYSELLSLEAPRMSWGGALA